jgi:hypothetical protein
VALKARTSVDVADAGSLRQGEVTEVAVLTVLAVGHGLGLDGDARLGGVDLLGCGLSGLGGVRHDLRSFVDAGLHLFDGGVVVGDRFAQLGEADVLDLGELRALLGLRRGEDRLHLGDVGVTLGEALTELRPECLENVHDVPP